MPPAADGQRKVSLMVPKMKIFYTFFVNDQLVAHPNLPFVNLHTEEVVVKFTHKAFKFLDSEYEFQLSQLNFADFDYSQVPLFDDYFAANCQSKPRFPREKYIPPKNKKARRKWNFNNSIFRQYRKDTDVHMENCFESDFALGRYSGFIKDKKDFAATRSYLKKHYREIKQVYKNFSSYSGVRLAHLDGSNHVHRRADDRHDHDQDGSGRRQRRVQQRRAAGFQERQLHRQKVQLLPERLSVQIPVLGVRRSSGPQEVHRVERSRYLRRGSQDAVW